MRSSILGAVSALALLTATGTALANHDRGHGPEDRYRPGPVREKVPEIPATGLAAGLVVIVGGAAVVLGRRRRSQ